MVVNVTDDLIYNAPSSEGHQRSPYSTIPIFSKGGPSGPWHGCVYVASEVTKAASQNRQSVQLN